MIRDVSTSVGLTTPMTRMICWFSCGGPSAVAAKLALGLYSTKYRVVVVNCDTRPSEHPDNYRFSADVERWLGVPIQHICSLSYKTVDDVFEKTRYMAGIAGARCTTELKKVPRFEFSRPDDVHVFGYTADKRERARAVKFESNNPELRLKWILIEEGVTKAGCLARLRQAQIALPVMYSLGFDNNNCPGCVKASSPWYWDMVRKHFPDVFKRRCQQSRKLGVRLVELHYHDRIFLDELPPGPFKRLGKKENLSCGPGCGNQQS